MLDTFKSIPGDMRDLGLAALSHVNRIEAQIDKWAELSVLQVAHAMEILIKARIAEEHPLLIFDKFPKPTKNPSNEIIDELTISKLSEKGHTIEWSSLLETLWATNNVKSINITEFNKFGEIRNSIQHFGIPPASTPVSYLTSLEFIYKVIDPFIYECWGLYAIDYCQDYNSENDDNSEYWNYIRKYLLNSEIKFRVSPTLFENKEQWWKGVKVDGNYLYISEEEKDYIEPIEISIEYFNYIENQKRICQVGFLQLVPFFAGEAGYARQGASCAGRGHLRPSDRSRCPPFSRPPRERTTAVRQYHRRLCRW